VSPPTTAVELDKKVSEIEEKAKWYRDNGESVKVEQIKEFTRK
jgi:hypothetical protein